MFSHRVPSTILALVLAICGTHVIATPAAAVTCASNVATGPAKYKVERQFYQILGTGDAWLQFQGTICANGTTAYVQSGNTASWVNNRTGIAPGISRGYFTDSGGTVNVWTDMKFTYGCGGETFVGWVQLRTWYYKNGTWSHGWYKPSNGKCQTEMQWR